MDTIETGLPFYDSISKQTREMPYFNAYLKEWICPKNRFPSFQFMSLEKADDIIVFNLVNVDTDVETDYITYFGLNVTKEVIDITTRWLHLGTATVSPSLDIGRYYFYVKTNFYGEDMEWWSEVFTVTNLEE